LLSSARDPIFTLADKRLVGPRWRASITLELATMVDRDKNDVYKKLAELPLRRYVEVLRNKAQDLTSMLGAPAYFDQYPSKRVPWIFSRTYGPIPLTATRHTPPTEPMNVVKVLESTITARNATTITDATQAWALDQYAGFTLEVAGQTRLITNNNLTVLFVTPSFSPLPPVGSTYQIFGSQGTTTGASTSSITDATQAWSANQFAAGYFNVKILTGPAAGQIATIVSNTPTSLTVSPSFSVSPGVGASYQILGSGFNQLAPLVDTSTYLLPREGTIKTGREAAFVWCSSNAFAYLSWTYTQDPEVSIAGSDPPAPLSVPINPITAGDLFDPLIPMNGGGVIVPNIANANYRSPRVCFELALYDKKRGRYLTDGSLPAEAFVGGSFSNKLTPKQTRWNVDTEIEPRLTITEVNMGPVLEAAKAYNAASVAVYVNVAFTGYNVLEEKYNEANTFSAIKSGG
jgi:hypothetical protein